MSSRKMYIHNSRRGVRCFKRVDDVTLTSSGKRSSFYVPCFVDTLNLRTCGWPVYLRKRLAKPTFNFEANFDENNIRSTTATTTALHGRCVLRWLCRKENESFLQLAKIT